MIICIYTPTMEGFLSAFFECYLKKIVPEIITCESNEYQVGLEYELLEVTPDSEKAMRVEKGIIKQIGSDGFYDIIRAYLSGDSNKEMIIFRYLIAVFKHGQKAQEMVNDKRIIDFNDLVRLVGGEAHRMKGFMRFKETSSVKIGNNVVEGKIYYAPFSPDHNIIEFMLDYFSQRNSETQFIIHDTARGLFGLYNGDDWRVISMDEPVEITLADGEQLVADLFKEYYNTVTIASRKNKRLQDGYLPRRYRKYLTEFEYK